MFGAQRVGAILDAEQGGQWSIAPVSPAQCRQFYAPDSNVLITRFLGRTGVVEVQDFMPVLRAHAPEDRQRDNSHARHHHLHGQPPGGCLATAVRGLSEAECPRRDRPREAIMNCGLNVVQVDGVPLGTRLGSVKLLRPGHRW